MTKLGMLGIIGGAALLTALPVSLQSQRNEGSAVPQIAVSQANAQTAGMQRREGRRDTRQSRRDTRQSNRQQRRTGQ
jgi:hypothetical protein